MTPIIRGAILAFSAGGLVGSLPAQSFIDLGSSVPTPRPNHIFPMSLNGDQTWPDSLNYFSNNNPPVSRSALGSANGYGPTPWYPNRYGYMEANTDYGGA